MWIFPAGHTSVVVFVDEDGDGGAVVDSVAIHVHENIDLGKP